MKLSARNLLKGTIVEVKKGQTTSHVRIDIGGGNVITASITNDSVDDLGLQNGKAAYAVIKSTSVMVAVDEPAARPQSDRPLRRRAVPADQYL